MNYKPETLNPNAARPKELALQDSGNHKGDFLDLLKHVHYPFKIEVPETLEHGTAVEIAHSTTVVALRYNEGIIIAGDRRATAGTSVIYDRAEKVLQIDRHSVLAIAGSPAMAYEIARILEHSFQYFRRSQLQELSLEGKLRMLARLIRENLAIALQGIGAVIPIFAIYDLNAADTQNGGKIFFYDALGAHFENVNFATTGSGSVWIRGTLRYLSRFGDTPLHQMNLQQATITLLRLLDIASEYDAATSGYNPKLNIFPTLKTVTRTGVQTLSQSELTTWYAKAQLQTEH